LAVLLWPLLSVTGTMLARVTSTFSPRPKSCATDWLLRVTALGVTLTGAW
jgi:hypothetical protein